MKKSTSKKKVSRKSSNKKTSTKKTTNGGSTSSVDIDLLKNVAEFMRTEGIAELNWKNAKSELRMLREGANQPIQQVTQVERSVPVPMPTTAPAATPAASSEANSPSTVTSSANHIVQSPFVGTFYRSSSPTKPPFVEKGQKVKKGDTLCIVEAMKLMNEIESDVDGVITKILMDNESPVEYGEALFEIELT